MLKPDMADKVASGELKGEIRRMKCTSKVGQTIYIAKCKTKTLIGTVKVSGLCRAFDAAYTKPRYEWLFSDPVKFDKPIPYVHPRGAQIWVNITLNTSFAHTEGKTYSQLAKHERVAARFLGYTSETWNTDALIPALGKEWGKMGDSDCKAWKVLGWSEELWQVWDIEDDESHKILPRPSIKPCEFHHSQPKEPSSNISRKISLMDEIETILKTVKETKQYRDKTKKVNFNLEWAFLLGEGTTNALGATSFETPHNFKKGRGVCLTKVEKRSLPKWKLKLWKLSKQLITLIDPDFAAGEFVVNYSCMNKPEQYVKKHVDSDDVSHQYAMALGNYKNAALRLYDENDKVIGDFDYHKKVCKMDGRLPHELVSDGFEGERFCVIWFKSYDHRQTKADPIFKTPCYVD